MNRSAEESDDSAKHMYLILYVTLFFFQDIVSVRSQAGKLIERAFNYDQRPRVATFAQGMEKNTTNASENRFKDAS